MASDRNSRETQTREQNERPRAWAPPGSFPMDLNNKQGVRYRWVRTHYSGAEEDKSNLYKRMQAGWRPVKAEDLPELGYLKDSAGNISLSGTTLCINSEETVQQALAYYDRQATGQLEGATAEFEKNQDSRVPKFSEGNLRTRTIKG